MSASPSFVLPAERLRLVVHPAEAGPTDLSISASLAVAGSDSGPGWLLQYRVQGDIDALAIPGTITRGPADGLWRHTCLEAFVQDGDGPGYREFNLSPSGQWAVYRFSGERQRASDDAPPIVGPSIDVERSAHSMTLHAWIPRALLPTQPTAIGLCAVIETLNGEVGHWALHHPRADRPDFHHSAGWTHRPALPPFPPFPPVAPSA